MFFFSDSSAFKTHQNLWGRIEKKEQFWPHSAKKRAISHDPFNFNAFFYQIFCQPSKISCKCQMHVDFNLWGKTSLLSLLFFYPGPHFRSETENRGTVQRASSVPVPGRETPAGQAEDGGTARADKAGWAQSPAQCGDISPTQSFERYRGQTHWTGSLHSTQGECKATCHIDRYLQNKRDQKIFIFSGRWWFEAKLERQIVGNGYAWSDTCVTRHQIHLDTAVEEECLLQSVTQRLTDLQWFSVSVNNPLKKRRM